VRFDRDDDFADGAAFLDQPHCGYRAGERIGPADDEHYMAGLDQASDLLEG
jgi:hypothetical protein